MTQRPELSRRALITGLILAAIMGLANLYFGLRVGMTVSASIPASVMAMLMLRTVLRNGSILEANQIQSAASTGESLAAGIIFTVPALLMAGLWPEINVAQTTLIALIGGILGVLFMVPLRSVFIVEHKELPFPEATACAAVLKAGDTERSKTDARRVIGGALTGGSIYGTLRLFLHESPAVEWAGKLGQATFYVGADLSPALLGIGFIVRLRVALLVFMGGAAAWLLALPVVTALAIGSSAPSALEEAWQVWRSHIRYLGVGMMLVGALTTLSDIGLHFRKLLPKWKQKHTRHANGQEDLSIRARAILALIALLLFLDLCMLSLGSFSLTFLSVLCLLPLGFVLCAMACYIVGLVGNSNSPVSGMTLCALLLTGLLITALGMRSTTGMLATLTVAAVICATISIAGDLCNDLKTGYLVGASPRKQQIMQLASAVVTALVVPPILKILHENVPGGLGGKELAAPQAMLFASLTRGLFGHEDLPTLFIVLGVSVGVALFVIERVLRSKHSSFHFPLMPVAIGLYLPFKLTVMMLIGGLVAHTLQKKAQHQRHLEAGNLLSSGLIAGESLMGVSLTLLSLAPMAQTWSTLVVATTVLALAFHVRPSARRI